MTLSSYYWIIPADVAGTWRWSLTTSAGMGDYLLSLDQRFQEIRGHVNIKGHEIPIGNARFIGDQLSFAFRDKTDKQNAVMRLSGRIRSDTIQGKVGVQGGPLKGSYRWTAGRTYLSLRWPALEY
jgi:hypothetical protein